MGSIWTLQDAKDSLAAVVEAAQKGEPQRVTTEGGEAVVVVSAHDYELMSKRPKTFVEHIMDFPKLPEGMDDIFDDRRDYPSSARDVDLGD